jgi:hypothetical protein
LRWRTLKNAHEEPGISGPGVGDTGTCCLANDRFPRQPDQPGVFLAFPRAHSNNERQIWP